MTDRQHCNSCFSIRGMRRLVGALLLVYIVVLLCFVFFQRQLIYIIQPYGTETPAKFGVPYSEVKIPVTDQTEIVAWWIKQANHDAPVLLYCHGNGGNLPALSHVAKIFYDYGLNALMFDYRAYGKSSKVSPSEEVLNQDSRAAYDWIKREKGVTDSNIVIWGHSLGSGVAARLAIDRSPAGLILEGAFPQLYDIGHFRYPWLLTKPFMYWDRFETEKYLKIRNMPLLMLHAEFDSIIPMRLGAQAYSIANEPKSWLVLKGIDHNDFPSVQQLYRQQILSFIDSAVHPNNPL